MLFEISFPLQESAGSFVCSVTFGAGTPRRIFGVDELQALQLAAQFVDAVTEGQAGGLSWDLVI